MNPITTARRKALGKAKSLAYSPKVRDAARRVLTSNVAEPVRNVLVQKGLEGHLQRLTSESLPDGKYFAKLTIENWKPFNGKRFRLYQGATVVYGNEVEPPPRGSQLEYRNFIVTSSNPANFSLNIDSPFTLQIGKGAFTTPQQINYDRQYGVEQHGDVFYSVRGNTTAPKKLLITFPGFGPSTSRISYAVSYLKGIKDTDLSDTLMVCFQDRYLAAGTYMLVDNSGRSLIERVNAVIRGFVKKYDIDEDQMLFFGASKGGSIAIQYADDYPAAQLLLAVPQMNLKYYLDKPFFRDNIFNETGMHSVPQPETLLRRYLEEGRRIDYFYTNSDEQSNFSLIEFVADVPGLTKYRVDGAHGDVAKRALPSMMGIMKRFLTGETSHRELYVEEFRSFAQESSTGVQVRIDDEHGPSNRSNWYLKTCAGATKSLVRITEHELPFVKYTSPEQYLNSAFDPVGGEWTLVALDDTGTVWEGRLPNGGQIPLADSLIGPEATNKLRLETAGSVEHFIVQGHEVFRYVYESRRGVGNSDKIDIHIVGDINDADLSEFSANSDSRFVAAVESTAESAHLGLMINRLMIASGCLAKDVVDHRPKRIADSTSDRSMSKTDLIHEHHTHLI